MLTAARATPDAGNTRGATQNKMHDAVQRRNTAAYKDSTALHCSPLRSIGSRLSPTHPAHPPSPPSHLHNVDGGHVRPQQLITKQAAGRLTKKLRGDFGRSSTFCASFCSCFRGRPTYRRVTSNGAVPPRPTSLNSTPTVPHESPWLS